MSGIRFKKPPSTLIGEFRRMEERTNKRNLRHQRKVAEAVMEDSIKNAPRDTTALEQSHRIEEYRENRRVVSTVVVGDDVIVNGKLEEVSKYVADVHQNYDTDYTPGEGTEEKRRMNPGRHIGSDFLLRAMADNEDKLNETLDISMEEIERVFDVFG